MNMIESHSCHSMLEDSKLDLSCIVKNIYNVHLPASVLVALTVSISDHSR